MAVAAALLALTACTADSDADDAGDAGEQTEPAAVETDLPPCPAGSGEPAAGDPVLTLDCLGGDTLDLAEAPGVPTVLNLWASWCAPCREELPYVQQLSEAAGEQVRVLGVDTKDGVPQGTSFAADAGLTFPSAFDWEASWPPSWCCRGCRTRCSWPRTGPSRTSSGARSTPTTSCGVWSRSTWGCSCDRGRR